MSSNPLDQPVPPAGEEIHLPGPTLLPLMLTVGVTMILLGVTSFAFLWVVGLLLTVGVLVRWVIDTKRDIAELPLEHEHPH
jgi:hypothetical protein